MKPEPGILQEVFCIKHSFVYNCAGLHKVVRSVDVGTAASRACTLVQSTRLNFCEEANAPSARSSSRL